MTRRIVRCCAVVAMALALGCAESDRGAKQPGEIGPPAASIVSPAAVERTLRLLYSVRNRGPQVLRDVEVGIYVPLLRTATQEATRLTATRQFELRFDALGNRIMVVRFDLAPHAVERFTVEAGVRLASAPSRLDETPLNVFSQPGRLIESDAPEVRAIATELRQRSRAFDAAMTHDAVRRRVRDTGYIRDARGAVRALRDGEGDCTEFAYAFVALARAQRVPSRAVEGFTMTRDGVVRRDDYHDWAEYFVEGLWRIADPQRGVFQDAPAEYVATRIVGPEELSGLGRAHRYRASDPNVEVRMN